MRKLLWLVLVGACGANNANFGNGGASSDGGVGCLASNECPTGYVCNDFGQCEMPGGSGSGSATPPETEITLGAPISAQRYVYVAMTAEDELARIDGVTLAVIATPVGKSPREVATIPGSDGAVVLDSDDGTATIVRPTAAADSIRVLATLQHLNRLDIDPTGSYAVAWFDLQKEIAENGITGVGSFQDVTVISLAQGNEHAVDLTVGFQPREVQFDAAGTHAFVITQDGVSAIDLPYATGHAPAIVPPIPVADPSVSPDDLEVQVVASGAYAAVRQAGLSAVRIVDLSTGTARNVPLGSPATDIDLAPDGSRVYAVARDAKQLAVIDVASATSQTVDLGDVTVGSITVSRDGTRALLYTNAELDEHITLVKLDEAGFPHVTWPLKKSVRAVGISPTSDTAIVLNAKAPGDPETADSVDEYIDESYGFTLLDLASGFGKLQLTPVDPGPFTYAPDGTKAYVGLDGGDDPTAMRALQIVNAHTGIVETEALGSPPSAVGILPVAAQAFAAQRHPLGRVTFIELDNDAMRTVTGFDLNSHVVQ